LLSRSTIYSENATELCTPFQKEQYSEKTKYLIKVLQTVMDRKICRILETVSKLSMEAEVLEFLLSHL
jgi:hypothetical protein